MTDHSEQDGIAIIGMAGRFPGADTVDGFWRNIKEGVDCVTRFDRDKLEVDLPEDSSAPDENGDYICARGILDGIDMFDARFFGYLPKEAEVMDPQHRIFLEICWQAMEHAGYDAQRYEGAVGVYGGCYMDTYVLHNLCADEAFRRKLVAAIQVGTLQTELGNDKDYLATRVAFKMGLRGPAMTLQTACSTSLVAIATACQSIDSCQCDMALAGGVTIVLPQYKGYSYKEGGMLSPDGVCRPFEEKAAGTVFSNGAAVLLLKRASDAVRDGDTIYAVIRGYATNNDGGAKLSYTAPSVDGQAEVISLALGMGGIDARSIGYVEAHGTATPLGDPIEISGLTNAFRATTQDRQFCAIGSVKANLGHLDCASGAIGLIKTSLCLHEKVLPPLLHFEKPNPKIDFENSPFYINTQLRDWPGDDGPRRAGVSSFGVGGTNAHVVVEEAPQQSRDPARRDVELVVLSARSESALAAQAENLAHALEADETIDLADAAHTLRAGRRAFDHRRAVVAGARERMVEQLRAAPGPAGSAQAVTAEPELVFMFPGQGAQYPGMGRRLYESEPVFRGVVDEIVDALGDCPDFDGDLRRFLLWREEEGPPGDEIAAELALTKNAQPCLFAVECALAALLKSWGLRPAGVIGHSVGEFAGAVSAGVLELGDGARLVAARGALMQSQPTGQMLAVMAPFEEIEGRLPPQVGLAAVNAPGACVVSGPEKAIAALVTTLDASDVACSHLKTSHAFHSSMMSPAKAPLIERAGKGHAKPAEIPFYSTLLGGLAPDDALCDPSYWGEQLMAPVLFCDTVQAAAVADRPRLFIEVGPGQTLTGLSRRCLPKDLGGDAEAVALAALGPVSAPGDDLEAVLRLVGAVWTRGGTPDWPAFTVGARRRVALPTYPFERKRFWVEPASGNAPESGKPIAASGPDANLENSQGDGVGQEPDQGEVGALIDRQLDVIAAQIALIRKG